MDNIGRTMKERAIKFMENDRKAKVKKEIELKKKEEKFENFIKYINNKKNSFILHMLSITSENPVYVYSLNFPEEIVQKSEKIINIVQELNKMDNIKIIILQFWNIMQDIADKKIIIKTDIEKNIIKSVESRIQRIFTIFDLGPIQFEIIMDDSNDLELATHIQNLVYSDCSDLEIKQGFENFGEPKYYVVSP